MFFFCWQGGQMSVLTCVFWETYGERGLLNLLFEQIFLVEEEDNGCVCEPFIITD